MITGPACDRLHCNRPGDITHLRNRALIAPGNAMRTLLTKLLITIALTLSGQAFTMQLEAGVAHDSWTPALVAMQGNGLTLSQAVERVRRKYPGGQIVDAKTEVSGGRETHVIRVLTKDGKVKQERVPGKRGR